MLISELYYEHALSDWLSLAAGRMSLRDSNVFASDETEQFVNASFNYNPVTGTTVPLVSLGAALYLTPADWLTVSTYALDSEGTAEQSGFDTAFERGTTVLQEFEFALTIGGLDGHQRIGWTWSDSPAIRFTQNPRDVLEAILAADAAGLARQSSQWSVYYDFDQHLVQWDDERGFGVFGRAGFGDEDVNPVAFFASAGLGGRGAGPGRPDDSYGLGLYYAKLSEELPAAVRARARDEEVGLEAYYNLAVTPWARLTADLQVIRPATDDVETTVVVGARLKVVF
jgi:porin